MSTDERSGETTVVGAMPGALGAGRAGSTSRRARRTLVALSLLGAVAIATPHEASAFPGFYVPGPRFYAPPVYAPPVYIPAPPVYVPDVPVYYVPRPRVRYYAPYRVRRPRFHP